MDIQKLARAAILLAALFAALGAQAGGRSWNFTSYTTVGAGYFPKPGGRMSLSDVEPDGSATVRFVFGNGVGRCMAGANPVSVSETETTTVITLPARLAGCDDQRFTIRKDGTGGYGETAAQGSGAWERSPLERGLTPRD